MNVETFLEQISKNWDSLLPSLKKEALESFRNTEKEVDFNLKNIKNIPNTFGVYLFKLELDDKFDTLYFKENWRIDKEIKCPNINKNYNKEAKKTTINLYVGKSETLSSRINDHCFHGNKRTTYGLKLANRTELIKSKITFSYFVLNNISDLKKNKRTLQFIITNLEKELRKDLKPWIGKQ